MINMKRFLGLLLIGGSIIACKKNKDEIINIKYLNNTWKIVEQSIDNEPIKPFLKIIKAVNVVNNQILWSDSLYFGDSKYVFDTGIGFENTCSLITENFGVLSGSWTYDISQNKLNICPSTSMDTTQNRDTLINGHWYVVSEFIFNTYEIDLLTESKLEMTSGNGNVHIKLIKE